MAGKGSRTDSKKGGGGNHRLQRIEREIRQIVGTKLITGFKGEVDVMTSVSRVIVASDLRYAKVFVTSMGNEAARKTLIKELQDHAGEFQHEVNRQMRMKYCPKITFVYDDGFDNVLKVDNILRELSIQRERDEAARKEQPKEETADEQS